MDFLNHCLTSTYFQYKGNRYKQLHKTAMGSPVSFVVAEIVMQSFEERALRTCRQTIPLWLRYVDGTFTAIHKDVIEAFNGRHPVYQRNQRKRTTNDTVPKTDAYRQINWRINSTQSYDYKDFDKTSATSL